MNTQKDAQSVPQDQDGGEGSPPAHFASFVDFMAFFARSPHFARSASSAEPSLVFRGCAG